MFRVHVVVREAGGLKPEYALDFDLPHIPRVGTYISIAQPGAGDGKTDDLIVRQVWWRLSHPERDASAPGGSAVGEATGCVLECAKAIGPYSTQAWRDDLLAAERAGFEIEVFDVEPRPGGYALAEGEPPVSKEAARRGQRRQGEAASALLGRADRRRRQH